MCGKTDALSDPVFYDRTFILLLDFVKNRLARKNVVKCIKKVNFLWLSEKKNVILAQRLQTRRCKRFLKVELFQTGDGILIADTVS